MALANLPPGRLIPEFTYILDVPERPEDMAKRWHNKYAKEAVQEMMEKHHRKNIPRHFKQENRRRYNHFPRTEKYKAFKKRRYGSVIDLVKTGRTRRAMTSSYKLRIGGTAEQGTLRANLILRFPFKGGSGRFRKLSPRNVKGRLAQETLAKMRKEIETFADDEGRQLRDWFTEGYWRRVENHRAGRKRMRLPRK